MLSHFNLDELLHRESEQVEWKENVADIDEVVATLSAFANDLQNMGGGYVVCGAREEKDSHGFPKAVVVGLDAARLKEVEGKVLTRCRENVSPPITPQVIEIEAADSAKRVLIFIQPATNTAHTFRTKHSSQYYARVSRMTIEARNGILREILMRNQTLEPWDLRVCAQASEDDIDLLLLKDSLVRLGLHHIKDAQQLVSDSFRMHSLVAPLFVKETLSNVLRPRNFALLLFGRDTQRFVPGAYSYFSRYEGVDRSQAHSERTEFLGTLLEQAVAIQRELNRLNVLQMKKENLSSPNQYKYPEGALFEAAGNMLAHRNYEIYEPSRITLFSDRIEFFSPGSLMPGVSKVEFQAGTCGPRWRNQTLAWIFMRLGFAQAEGQGVSTIRRLSTEAGLPEPRFAVTENSVTCTLFGRSLLVG